MSRVAELFSSFPLVTCALTTINIVIHAFVFLFSAPVGLLAINPARVIYASEVVPHSPSVIPSLSISTTESSLLHSFTEGSCIF
jgi:hypothetical protein